jgi:hypothetical protein
VAASRAANQFGRQWHVARLFATTGIKIENRECGRH